MEGPPRDGTISVLVVDDDSIVRQSLRVLIDASAGLAVAGLCSSGEEALRVVAERAPDVVLMDIHLQGMNGVETTRRIHEWHPDVTVIALTTFDDDEYVVGALAAGARAFLLKTTTSQALVRAIQVAHSGGAVISSQPAARLVNAVRSMSAATLRTDPAIYRLGERETEVLLLLSRAASNAEIAETLFLSDSTVKAHVSSIMTKLSCSSRLQVAIRAIELGLVPPPGQA